MNKWMTSICGRLVPVAAISLLALTACCGSSGEQAGDARDQAAAEAAGESSAYDNSLWAVQVLGSQIIPADPEFDFVAEGFSILSVELSIEYRGQGEPVLGTLGQVALTTSDGQACPIYALGSSRMAPEEGFNVYSPRDMDYTIQYTDTVDSVDVPLFTLSAATPDQESILGFFGATTVMRFGFEVPAGSSSFRLAFADARPVDFGL